MAAETSPRSTDTRRTWSAAPLFSGGVATVALLLGFGQHPLALALHGYWLALVVASLVLSDRVWRPRAHGVLLREGVTGLVAIAALVPILVPPSPAATGPWVGNERVWTLAFGAMEEALTKTVSRPEEWDVQPLHLRIDLIDHYDGPAGFLVEVNGQTLGRLDAASNRSPSTDRMLYAVPRSVVAGSEEVIIVLRPAAIDPRLRIVGHPDPNSEPLRERNSWFFDGRVWRNDRLAGGSARVVGTYRVWLLDDLVLTREDEVS